MNLLNDPPGFECPICHKAQIRVSLKAFLTREEVRCSHCGTPFHMQREGCEEMERLLGDYQRAYENLETLQGRAPQGPPPVRHARNPRHAGRPELPSRRLSSPPRRTKRD